MEEAHDGICGAHWLEPKLRGRIKRMDYYWSAIVRYYINLAKRCDACQFHANFIHHPLEAIHPTIASWPFEAWELDVVRRFTLKSSTSHMHILVAADYFSKWAEVVALKEAKKENIVNFI